VAPETLRRIAVTAAGLHRAAGFGRGAGAGKRVLDQLGYVQIDTISVVRRSHEHIVDVRAEAFHTRDWNRLVARGEAFEYWAHAAAYLPLADFRYSLLRMKHYASRHPYGLKVGPEARAAVLDRIRAEGPLRARDFEDEARHEIGGWGRYKDSKIALEQLWHEGTLTIVTRDGFEKTYDLVERALPDGVDTREPTLDELAVHLVERARRALGVFSPPHVTRLRREPGIRPAVGRALDAALEEGSLVRIAPPGEPTPTRWYADAQALARPPRVSRRPRLLSPFDPLVTYRDRAERLFGFDYQLECYVPEEKRQHGYFVLPLLQGTRFLGRADCKADRSRGVLQVRHIAVEDGAPLDEVEAAARTAVGDLALRDDCAEVEWLRVSAPTTTAARELQRALSTG
jgi:uncharacterized protein YcaQ